MSVVDEAELAAADEARRRLRRDFHRFALGAHPDLGGDRDHFEEGLARYRAALAGVPSGASAPAAPAANTNVRIEAHRAPGLARALRRWWRRRPSSAASSSHPRPGASASGRTREKVTV